MANNEASPDSVVFVAYGQEQALCALPLRHRLAETVSILHGTHSQALTFQLKRLHSGQNLQGVLDVLRRSKKSLRHESNQPVSVKKISF